MSMPILIRFSKLIRLIATQTVLKLMFKSLGKRTIIMPARLIVGAERVSIGANCLIERDATIYAICEYAGIKYSPEVSIGDGVYINHSFNVTSASRVQIDENVTIAYNVSVFDFNHGFDSENCSIRTQPLRLYSAGVHICENAWIGANVFICGNVRIGRGAVVGANSVVKTDVPEYSVVAGNPARIIRSLRKNTGGEL